MELFFGKFTNKFCVLVVLGFVAGIFLAFVLPPVIIAVIEGVLLAFVCWLLYCSD